MPSDDVHGDRRCIPLIVASILVQEGSRGPSTGLVLESSRRRRVHEGPEISRALGPTLVRPSAAAPAKARRRRSLQTCRAQSAAASALAWRTREALEICGNSGHPADTTAEATLTWALKWLVLGKAERTLGAGRGVRLQRADNRTVLPSKRFLAQSKRTGGDTRFVEQPRKPKPPPKPKLEVLAPRRARYIGRVRRLPLGLVAVASR